MKENDASDIEETEESLRIWLSDARRVVIAGVGSPLRRDDFVGVEIVKRLQGKVSGNVSLLECETVPESFLEPISDFKPTHVLIIDAALLNLKPGASRLVKPNEIAGVPLSTHTLPLSLFSEYLTETTGAEVALLAIQPKETDFGEDLTEELKKTATDLTGLLIKILPRVEPL
jgi:hydrogenase 3 maturation protease